MSRPHDGQRAFSPFGNPFRMIFPKGSDLSPELLALLNSFERTLAESLKRIKPKDISDVLSLYWMRQAMEFLSETHTNIKTLITDLQFPVSDWDDKWVDVYLDSSVKLLDICIALSSELSRLDQGQLLLQYALHILDSSSDSPSSEQLGRAHASLRDWIQQMNSRSPKLASCLAILQGLAGTLYVAKVKNSAKGKVLMRVLYGVRAVTVYLCGILAAALSGCPEPLVELQVSGKFLWAGAFNDLRAEVNKEVRGRFASGKVTGLKDVEAVEVFVERLHALTGCVGHEEGKTLHKCNGVCREEEAPTAEGIEDAEKLRVYVSDLARSSERLSEGLDLLSKQVGGFFQIVLTGRDALLCNFRESDVMKVGNAEDSNRL